MKTGQPDFQYLCFICVSSVAETAVAYGVAGLVPALGLFVLPEARSLLRT